MQTDHYCFQLISYNLISILNSHWLYLSGNDCAASAGTWFLMLYVNCDRSFSRTNTMLLMPMTLEAHPSCGMFSGGKVLSIYPLSTTFMETARELQHKLFKSLQHRYPTTCMIRSTVGILINGWKFASILTDLISTNSTWYKYQGELLQNIQPLKG